MMSNTFFSLRPAIEPKIYVYRLIGVQSHAGYIKIGYTERDVEVRVKEQSGATHVPYEILYTESAMTEDGSIISDKQVHKMLEKAGFRQLDTKENNEFYNCSVGDVKKAIYAVKNGLNYMTERTRAFGMRPEQYRAVTQTANYYVSAKQADPSHPPKFLWNAKMRFGKTFASYELAKKMGFKRVLVLTFKPAVESAWREDLLTHVDFDGWQFVSNKDAHYTDINIDEEYARADKNRPIVVFGSFQDLLGTNDAGGIKAKNEFIHLINWDLVIFDEYHFGAWRENAARLFDNPDDEADADFDAEKYKLEEADNAYNESFLPITAEHYLFLSGTPFRALNSGEFIEEQIFSWTYSDEQAAKDAWVGSGNPYLSLPRMIMMTYKIPDAIRQIAMQGEFNEFDLNLFFSAKAQEKGKPESSQFVYKDYVQKWLDLIRGAYLPGNIDDLKLGSDKRPPMPYSDARLLGVLTHTLWFLPNVASCFAMKNLLMERQNTFYHDYEINVCAGTKAGIGLDALAPVQHSMGDPLATKTITLSCGKLTTGVTVKPWSGVFMLRNLKSPETYFQTAFRVQSPWTIRDENGEEVILKDNCYVFDFALDRALKQVAEYAGGLNTSEGNPEKKVADFMHFLPVLAYDGSKMVQLDPGEVLQFTLAGTSATLLARRWESALLVNVDNETLSRLLNNKAAMDALQSIEGFRSLNQDIETIINKSEAVKKAKKEGEGEKDPKKKKELSDEEKEYKSKRKEIQEKLIKFATRIPVFMYLTDMRELCLKDIIMHIEEGLFKKVTGLNIADFDLLCSIGVFNSSLMNQAVFAFKRYEDSSLTYTGIDKHEGETNVGGWDTVIKKEEYQRMFYNQQATMQPEKAPAPAPKPAEPPKAPEKKPEPPKAPERKAVQIPVKPQPIVPQKPTVKPQEPPKEAFVMPKIHEGMAVVHKVFGEGTITKIHVSENKINVDFVKGGEKTMVIDPNSPYNAFKMGVLKIK